MVEKHQMGAFDVELRRQEGVTPAEALAKLRPPRTTGALWWKRTFPPPHIPNPELHFETIMGADISTDGQHFMCVGVDGSHQYLIRDDQVLLSGEFTFITSLARNYHDFAQLAIFSEGPQTGHSFHLIDKDGNVQTLITGKDEIKTVNCDLARGHFIFITKDATGKYDLYVINQGKTTTPLTGALRIDIWGITWQQDQSRPFVNTVGQDGKDSLHLVTLEGQTTTLMETVDDLVLVPLTHPFFKAGHIFGGDYHLVTGRNGESAVFTLVNQNSEQVLVGKLEVPLPEDTYAFEALGVSQDASTFFWRAKETDGSYNYFRNSQLLTHSPSPRGGVNFETNEDLSRIWLVSPADAPQPIINYSGQDLLTDHRLPGGSSVHSYILDNSDDPWITAAITLKEAKDPSLIFVATPDSQRVLGPFDKVNSIALGPQKTTAQIMRGNIPYQLTITPGTGNQPTTVEETPLPAAA